MPKKILLCATVDYHFQAFHLPFMKWFKEQGWEVHVAANGGINLPYTDFKYDLPIQRSPFDKENIRAFRMLKKILKENEFDLIHCHTPMGGMLTRIAAGKARKNGTKVIYTAHGFHFCKGSSFVNWFLYYPVEKSLSYLTDCLITINKEDFQLAKKKKFKSEKIEFVNGVGVDTERFTPVNHFHKSVLRAELGYKNDEFLMFYAAEFNKNKNQLLLIQVLSEIKDEVPNAKLLLAGEGQMLEQCRSLAAKLGVTSMVDFLGYRKDIVSLLKMSDIAIASSLREGLPVNIMEAMACGLPVVATDNRGHRELISNNYNGWTVNQSNLNDFSHKIKMLAESSILRYEFGRNGRKIILSKYSSKRVLEEMSSIYSFYMEGNEEIKWNIQYESYM